MSSGMNGRASPGYKMQKVAADSEVIVDPTAMVLSQLNDLFLTNRQGHKV
jgi:hypothetical protein